MLTLDYSNFTDMQIRDALYAASGSRGVAFRFDLLQDGAVIKHLNASGSVSYKEESEIKRTARFKIYDLDIDWLISRIKPYMLVRMPDRVMRKETKIMPVSCFDELGFSAAQFDALELTAAMLDQGIAVREKREEQYAQFPLGVYIPSTPSKVTEESAVYYNVEAFDLTVILREDSLTERLFLKAGTKYLDAVQSILVGAGIDQVLIMDPSDAAFPTDREFEMGERKLALCNTLLEEINFNQLECDSNGNIVISKYREPTPERVSYTYHTDEASVILPQGVDEIDYFNVPNVFIATCTNPELEQDYQSIYINDNPNSRLSTVRRGRRIVSEIYQPDLITSQEDLDDYIRRIAFEQSQVSRKLQFYSMLMPVHGTRDILLLDCGQLASGIFVQNGWSMELQPGARMLHEVRGLVQV